MKTQTLNRNRVLLSAALMSDALGHRGPQGSADPAPDALPPCSLLRRALNAFWTRLIRAQQARADAELMRLARLDHRVWAEIEAARLRAEWSDEEARHD